MLRHVVLFRWNDGTTGEQVQAVADRLRRLPAEIPEISKYSVGRDLGLTEGAADFSVVAEFASVEDWQAYIQHPAHLRAIEEVIAPIRESRVVVQYEMEE